MKLHESIRFIETLALLKGTYKGFGLGFGLESLAIFGFGIRIPKKPNL